MIFNFWFKDIDIPVIVWLVDAVICNDSYLEVKAFLFLLNKLIVSYDFRDINLN